MKFDIKDKHQVVRAVGIHSLLHAGCFGVYFADSVIQSMVVYRIGHELWIICALTLYAWVRFKFGHLLNEKLFLRGHVRST